MGSFRWLQFSDLHSGLKSFNASTIRQQLLKFLEEKKFDCDAVFITGDVANQGNYDEDTIVFIRNMLGKITLSNAEHIYWAVGNHDIKRDIRFRKQLITEIRSDNNPTVKFEEFAGNEEDRSVLTSLAMKDYTVYYEKILGRSLSNEAVVKTCSPYVCQ